MGSIIRPCRHRDNPAWALLLRTSSSLLLGRQRATKGDRTVTLTLQASANYTLTTVSNATVVINDRPIDAWRLANFTTAELANPSISGDLADPDHDGLANLMEYALGLPPKTANANPFMPSVHNGYLTITYTKSKSATDVTLTTDWSTDLVSWQSGPTYVQQTSLVDQGATQLITVQATTPVSPGHGGFLRLRVTRLP